MKGQWKAASLIGLIAIIHGLVAASAVCRPGPSFNFAVVGDRTGGAVPGVFEQVLEEVALLNPDIIVTVGDHIEGYEADSAEIEREWSYVIEIMDRTGIEYHLTAGNHDIWDEQSRAIYRNRFGSPDTAFEYLGNLFVIIDVSTYYRADGVPPEKLTWLEDVLDASGDITNIFVFYHKPFWCEDFSAGRSNVFHEMFKRHGVNAVFTGHYHRHFYTERDGIRYFGVSSSGGSLPPGGREKGAFFSYLLAKVEGESLTVRLLEPGLTLPVDVVTVADALRIAEIERTSVRLSEIILEDIASSGTSKITVTIENRAPVTLRDTASWSSPAGWTVEPQRDYVEVPSGEVGTLTAFATADGQVFPVPSLTLNVPYEDGRAVEVTEPLRVRRAASARRTDQSPQVDGVLDESAWRNCEGETEFFDWQGARSSGDSTVLKICYDSTSLYVGIECMESEAGQISATVRDRDGLIRYDDNVAVLLEPVRGSGDFYQISVNPIGTVSDQKIEICPFGTYVLHPEWDPNLKVGTQLLDDRWVVELAVPLGAMGTRIGDDSRWGFNFLRWHVRLGVASTLQPPVRYDSDRTALLQLE